jgi:hypothetical protein
VEMPGRTRLVQQSGSQAVEGRLSWGLQEMGRSGVLQPSQQPLSWNQTDLRILPQDVEGLETSVRRMARIL